MTTSWAVPLPFEPNRAFLDSRSIAPLQRKSDQSSELSRNLGREYVSLLGRDACFPNASKSEYGLPFTRAQETGSGSDLIRVKVYRANGKS